MKTKKIIIIAIILIVVALGFFAFKKFTGNIVREGSDKQNELVENCKCIERENLKCSNGYELNEGVCINEEKGTFTNVLLGCSKYDCDGEIWRVKN